MLLTLALVEDGWGLAAGGREGEHTGHVDRYRRCLGPHGGAEAVDGGGGADGGLDLPAAGLARPGRLAAGRHVVEAVGEARQRGSAVRRWRGGRGGRTGDGGEREEDEDAGRGGGAAGESHGCWRLLRGRVVRLGVRSGVECGGGAGRFGMRNDRRRIVGRN